MIMNYRLASSTWDHKELDAIQKVIDSDMYTMGNNVKQFEIDFSKYLNSKYCVMTSSGSTANLIMIAALFYKKKPLLKRGDEVIVPAVSWSTTYFPLQQYGLKVKFVDIDINTLNYDLDALSNAISDKTKMIMVVNLLGNPNDFNKINRLIKNRNIFLIEDNCESLGAKFCDKYTGTFGLMGSFSTFFSHHITTMEGGFICTDDEELYHILLCLRAHGWTRNLPKKNHISDKSDDWFSESFRFVLPGYNVRPLEMSGAIGIEQIKKLSNFIDQRRKNAKIFHDLFSENSDFYIQKEIGQSSWFGFSLIIKPESSLKRKDVIKMLDSKNIDTRPIVTGDFTQNSHVLKFFDYEIHGNLKNAKYLHNNGFFVGNHQVSIEKEINYLFKSLNL